MRRRALLGLFGTTSLGALAGCSLTVPEVKSSSVEAQDRRCNDSPEGIATIADVSENGTRIQITGRIVVPRIRDTLYIRAQNGEGSQEYDDADVEVQINFSPSDTRANTNVPECAGLIDYQAGITATSSPSSVIIRHMVEGADEFTLKTIATDSIE